MLCIARAWQPPGSRSPQLGISGLYTRSQAQTRTFVGWLAHAEKEGKEVCRERMEADKDATTGHTGTALSKAVPSLWQPAEAILDGVLYLPRSIPRPYSLPRYRLWHSRT